MKKRVFALVLTAVMVLTTAVVVMANPANGRQTAAGQNPNQNPGGPTMTTECEGYTVTVTGGGNNLMLRVIRLADGHVYVVPRAGNGTFSQTFVATSGTEIFIRVQGNSLLNYNVTAPYIPCINGCDPADCPTNEPNCTCNCNCYVPTIIASGYFRRFVRNDQLADVFINTSEVAGSRVISGGVSFTTFGERVNFTDLSHVNGTGMGVRGAGFTASGTVDYQFVRNYVERFIAVYEYVDYVVWSSPVKGSDENGRIETVRENSQFNPYDAFNGAPVVTGPFAGSFTFDVTGTAQGYMCRGEGGQAVDIGRTTTATSDGFTVDLYLADTGNPPTINITSWEVDVDAL
jgi:hypothetical protein